jgi:outer membrane protein OmpA-like peptidoglycan-associated protein
MRKIEVRPPSGFLKIEAPDQNLWGLRLSWDLLRWGPGLLQASGGLALGSSSPLRFTNSVGASGDVGADLHLRQQWMGGLLYRLGSGRLNYGIGLDLRRDVLMVKAAPDLRSSGSTNRLWTRAAVQYHFDAMGRLLPHLALDVAVPLSHTNPSGVAYIGDLDHLGLPSNVDEGVAARTHAPRLQFIVAVGARFGAPRPRPVATACNLPTLEPVARLETRIVPQGLEAPAPPVIAPAPIAVELPQLIVLDDAALHFALDRAEISEEGRRVLARWAARILAVSPQPRLTITGHTDGTGSLAHNLDLSTRRAQAVAETLRNHGLAVETDAVSGRGPREPRASNRLEEGRARNRRVEIHLDGARPGKGRVESAPQLTLLGKPGPKKPQRPSR